MPSPGDLPNPGIESTSTLIDRQISSTNILRRVNTCSSVQSLSHVQLFTTQWTAARQASLSITNSPRLLKLMSVQLVMPSNLCCPILLLPSIFPSFRVFSNESVLHIRWPKYWSFSFSISPSNEYSGLVSSSETLPKSCRRRRISNSLCEASITLIPKQPEISHTHTFAGQYH